jgi:hypothetical protein
VPPPTEPRRSWLRVFLRSALFPLLIIAALAWTATETLREEAPRPRPRADVTESLPSLSEAQRGWYVLADYKCFSAVQALDGMNETEGLELKARTVDEIGANEPPAAGIVAVLRLEASLRAEYRALELERAGKPADAERRTATREADAGISVLAEHGAPSCRRAFG